MLSPMATTTATSTAGTLGSSRMSPRIRSSENRPMAADAGTTSPSVMPVTTPLTSPRKLSASIEKPSSLGSWPTRIVRARPFM